MLDGLIAMLETLKTIEELKLDQDGNGIDLGEIFTITDDGSISEFTDTFTEWWKRLQTAVGEIRFDNSKFNLGEALARGIVTPNLLQDCSNEI